MDETRYQDFSPAADEEFAFRWQFEFSRDGTNWFSFAEDPHLFDLSVAVYRLRYWTYGGQEVVTAPSSRTPRPQDATGG